MPEPQEPRPGLNQSPPTRGFVVREIYRKRIEFTTEREVVVIPPPEPPSRASGWLRRTIAICIRLVLLLLTLRDSAGPPTRGP